jgi:hypothetical protein
MWLIFLTIEYKNLILAAMAAVLKWLEGMAMDQ